jgi:GT2 family glycosyltransferase
LVDHAGIFFDLEGMPTHAHKNRRNPPRGLWKERNAATAACMVVKRYVFDTLEGFDERFRNGMEDIDFCVRMKKAGYRIIVSHESVVGHLVSSSPGRHASNQTNIDLYRRVRAPSAAVWGRREWASEYFRRYARHWWRMKPSKALLALRLLITDLIYTPGKKPID